MLTASLYLITVIEAGSHSQLMEHKGAYYKLNNARTDALYRQPISSVQA